MEEILTSTERKEKEIKERLLRIQKNKPSITDGELAKAYLTCMSSRFDLRQLAPILAELMTRVEGKEYKSLNAELHTIDYYDEYTKKETTGWYSFLAIVNSDFDLETKEEKWTGIPTYRYEGSKYDFFQKYVEFYLIDDKYSTYDYFKYYYEPKSSGFAEKSENLFKATIKFSDKYYYLEEFLRGVVGYRVVNNGKKLSKEELHQLMEYYIENYHPIPIKKREIELKLEQ